MNITHLYVVQRDLDLMIKKKHQLLNMHQWKEQLQKKMAFKVEVGELGNELPGVFKWWKTEQTVDNEKVLEEWADCLSFLLGYSILMDYYKHVQYIHTEHLTGESYLTLFNRLFESSLSSTGQVLIAFEHLFAIGHKLGFTNDQLEAAYLQKNKKNYLRQEENY